MIRTQPLSLFLNYFYFKCICSLAIDMLVIKTYIFQTNTALGLKSTEEFSKPLFPILKYPKASSENMVGTGCWTKCMFIGHWRCWLYGRIIKSFDASVTPLHFTIFFRAINFFLLTGSKNLFSALLFYKRLRLHRLVKLHYGQEKPVKAMTSSPLNHFYFSE